MLNEDKIKLMTRIAMFEKKEGKRIFPVNSYFRGDYVGRHMIRSFFNYTLSAVLFISIWILSNIDMFMNDLNTDDLLLLGKRFLIIYGGGLLLYLILTFVIYSKRYSYANRGMKVYVAKLKRLEKRYEFQNKTKELAKEGRPL